MARKSSDLFTMLKTRGSRRGGRRSGGGGMFSTLGRLLQAVTGGGRRSQDLGPSRRRVTLSGLAALGIAFACLGVGYLLGDAFPMRSREALRMSPPDNQTRPVQPGTIGADPAGLERFRLDPEVECVPLSNQAYFLAAFPDDARQRASDLALYLRSKGIATARLHRSWERSLWVVLAYFDGPRQGDELRKGLQTVAAPAHLPEFERFRKGSADWPPAATL